MYPKVPDVLEGELSHEELCELWTALIFEIINPELTGRTHHNRRTYDAGCQGPLCTKAMREYGRRRTASTGPGRHAASDAILTAWHPEAYKRIEEVRQRLVAELTTAK